MDKKYTNALYPDKINDLIDNDGNINEEVIGPAIADKADLVNGKVPAEELPSYVDDVVEYASIDEFPEEGEAGKIYVDIETGDTYRWSGTTYVQIGGQDLSLYPTREEVEEMIEEGGEAAYELEVVDGGISSINVYSEFSISEEDFNNILNDKPLKINLHLSYGEEPYALYETTLVYYGINAARNAIIYKNTDKMKPYQFEFDMESHTVQEKTKGFVFIQWDKDNAFIEATPDLVDENKLLINDGSILEMAPAQLLLAIHAPDGFDEYIDLLYDSSNGNARVYKVIGRNSIITFGFQFPAGFVGIISEIQKDNKVLNFGVLSHDVNGTIGFDSFGIDLEEMLRQETFNPFETYYGQLVVDTNIILDANLNFSQQLTEAGADLYCNFKTVAGKFSFKADNIEGSWVAVGQNFNDFVDIWEKPQPYELTVTADAQIFGIGLRIDIPRLTYQYIAMNLPKTIALHIHNRASTVNYDTTLTFKKVDSDGIIYYNNEDGNSDWEVAIKTVSGESTAYFFIILVDKNDYRRKYIIDPTDVGGEYFAWDGGGLTKTYNQLMTWIGECGARGPDSRYIISYLEPNETNWVEVLLAYEQNQGYIPCFFAPTLGHPIPCSDQGTFKICRPYFYRNK